MVIMTFWTLTLKNWRFHIIKWLRTGRRILRLRSRHHSFRIGFGIPVVILLKDDGLPRILYLPSGLCQNFGRFTTDVSKRLEKEQTKEKSLTHAITPHHLSSSSFRAGPPSTCTSESWMPVRHPLNTRSVSDGSIVRVSLCCPDRHSCKPRWT